MKWKQFILYSGKLLWIVLCWRASPPWRKYAKTSLRPCEDCRALLVNQQFKEVLCVLQTLHIRRNHLKQLSDLLPLQIFCKIKNAQQSASYLRKFHLQLSGGQFEKARNIRCYIWFYYHCNNYVLVDFIQYFAVKLKNCSLQATVFQSLFLKHNIWRIIKNLVCTVLRS